MIHILKLNHRVFRDQRISSHVFLAGRAFGADLGSYTGQRDEGMETSIKNITENWGGNFKIKYLPHWKPLVKEWKNNGKVVHLTMYGIPIKQKIEEIRKVRNILVIVGGEKVPFEVYKMADWNVSITNQPHSEVSSLAIFLYEYFEGNFPERFKDAKLKIVPEKMGKNVIRI